MTSDAAGKTREEEIKMIAIATRAVAMTRNAFCLFTGTSNARGDASFVITDGIAIQKVTGAPWMRSAQSFWYSAVGDDHTISWNLRDHGERMFRLAQLEL